MFACLYDKNLRALGNWSTYATTKWSLVRKAYEFDELSVTTREMDNSLKAAFIGLHNDDGSLKYLAFSGKPATKDGLTTYKGTDIRQIYKSEAVIDFTNVALENKYDTQSQSLLKTKLMQIYEYLLLRPLSEVHNGFTQTPPEEGATYQVQFKVDTSDLGEHPHDTRANDYGWKEEALDRTPGIGVVWDLIQAVNMIYDCYVEIEVDLVTRTITAKVKRIYNLISFKLSDFNESRVINDTSVTNRIITRIKESPEDEIGVFDNSYFLLSNDTVVSNSGLTSDKIGQIIQPTRIEVILEESREKATALAIQKLMSNRFKGKVEINTDCSMGYLLQHIELNTFADIYGYNAADDSTKRRLPVMQISQNETGKTRVSFGRLTQYWF